MKYREFDWEHAKNVRKTNPTKLNWLWMNHKEEVDYETFAREMLRIKSFSVKKRAKKYSPSKLLTNYLNLKQEFGFFTGEIK